MPLHPLLSTLNSRSGSSLMSSQPTIDLTTLPSPSGPGPYCPIWLPGVFLIRYIPTTVLSHCVRSKGVFFILLPTMSHLLLLFFLFFINRSIFLYLFLRYDSRRMANILTVQKDGCQINGVEDVKRMLALH
jgi:hypothetical protein